MATTIQRQPKQNKNKNIVILGAGITGLSTALYFLTADPKSSIIIIATHLPSDRSPDYTSPWAGGHWRSHAGVSDSEAQVRKWDSRTYQHWTSLLSSPSKIGENSRGVEERLGLGFRESQNFWGVEGPETEGGDGRGLWWSKDTVTDFRILKEEERKEGAVMGVRYRSVAFDPPLYLNYLLGEIQAISSRARIIQTTIETDGGLEGVVRAVKASTELEAGQILCLVNCTGLGARKLVSDEEAAKLFPIRGQTLLVKGEAKGVRTYTDPPGLGEGGILYVVPRPGSGTTVIGGCKEIGNWETEIDEHLNERIIDGVKKFRMVSSEDGLLDSNGEFKIIAKQVGFRPGRKGGPRVELESMVAGVWIIHSYGHGGGGFQASWGSAEQVAAIIEGLL